MNCLEFEQIVTELARGPDEQSSGRDALVHARECNRCGRRLAAEQTLTRAFTEVAAGFGTETAPPRVENALLAAFRQTTPAAISGSRGTASGWNRWALSAVAASALIATAAALLWMAPEPQNNVPAAGIVEPLPAAATVADFLPLLYAEPINAWEHGRVVRVRLPGSALVHFGLPMNMTTASQLVDANVLLGEDGMARGVRLVTTAGAGR